MVLVAARAVIVGLFAAVIPASLVYIGDTMPMATRRKALEDQLGATAAATALATYFGLWRLAFAVPVLVSGVLGLLIAARLPEPQRRAENPGR